MNVVDDRPMNLKEAAAMYGLTVATLRAEAARGRLEIFRIGRRDYTTIQAMREMVRKCRDAARQRAFTPAHDVRRRELRLHWRH
jgi:hypothetical protein